MHRFDGDLTRQEGLPDAAIERAVALLRSGRLHRYQTGEAESEAAALEREFAAWQGAPYCLACTSKEASRSSATTTAGRKHEGTTTDGSWRTDEECNFP
ncbi:MAG: hypothetical protein AAF460_10850, partial [Pseudomonadota bacterium]